MDSSADASNLKLQLQTVQSERIVLERKLCQMNEDLKQMLAEKNDAIKEKMDAVSRCDKILVERDRLIKERMALQKQVQDKEKQFGDALREGVSPELFEATFKVQLDNMQKRHEQSAKLWESEKLRLVGVIESLKISNESKEDEIERLKQEHSSLRRNPSSKMMPAKDKKPIQNTDKIVTEESQKNAINNGTTRDDNSLDDNDSYQQQIDFLNSVIVELQRKNMSLEARLQVLESIGSLADSMIEEKITNGSSSSSLSRRLAPRLFCDVCEVFDLHDTDDCPDKDVASLSPPPSHHHGTISLQRPYCTCCEVFGHSVEACIYGTTS